MTSITDTAVEIDRLSGRLLQSLYAPHGADVRIAPFEKLALPENWFDLVIGNVPFGNYQALICRYFCAQRGCRSASGTITRSS